VIGEHLLLIYYAVFEDAMAQLCTCFSSLFIKSSICFFFPHKKRMHKRRVELAKYLYDEVSTKGYYVVIKESKVRRRQI
jgi:hypothetical protein